MQGPRINVVENLIELLLNLMLDINHQVKARDLPHVQKPFQGPHFLLVRIGVRDLLDQHGMNDKPKMVLDLLGQELDDPEEFHNYLLLEGICQLLGVLQMLGGLQLPYGVPEGFKEELNLLGHLGIGEDLLEK